MHNTWTLALLVSTALTGAAARADTTLPPDLLFYETFDSVTGDFSGSDPRRYGIPTAATFGSDENWHGARFDYPDNGMVTHDVGAQFYGGGGNLTQTGFAEDRAGMMFRIDASFYQDIVLEFDWRTFSAGSEDRLVVGYFVGDLAAGHPAGFDGRVIDLRTSAAGGPGDGAWNWGSGWTELARLGPSNSFSTASFALPAAAGASQVWVAFWMDGGENDFAKFDNVKVIAEPIPAPGAVWLLASALTALYGARRRRA